MKLINTNQQKHDGFTLLELILVIAILSILFTIIALFLNPGDRINKANDSRRLNDIGTISKAIQQYYIDHNSYSDLNINKEKMEICDSRYENNFEINCNELLNLNKLVPLYLVGIPTDPKILAEKDWNKENILGGNGYEVYLNSNGNISVSSKYLGLDEIKTLNFRELDFSFNKIQTIILIISIIIIIGLTTFYIIKTYETKENK